MTQNSALANTSLNGQLEVQRIWHHHVRLDQTCRMKYFETECYSKMKVSVKIEPGPRESADGALSVSLDVSQSISFIDTKLSGLFLNINLHIVACDIDMFQWLRWVDKNDARVTLWSANFDIKSLRQVLSQVTVTFFKLHKQRWRQTRS